MAHTIRVGTSGWTYPHWRRGVFYPPGLRQRDELAYAAERLTSMEINGSFYSLQRPTSYAAWHDATPEHFLFAVKGGRFITHMKRLRDVGTPLANFLASGVLALRDKLGPVLWQLPERVEFDADVVGSFLALLPRTSGEAAELAGHHDAKVPADRALTALGGTAPDRPLRHVLEFRHPSFCEPAALDLLRAHDVGCVVADTAGRFPQADVVTTDVVYVRLHGDTELYRSGYSSAALDHWAERCRAWAREADVYVYFDNDGQGNAPHDAISLLERLG